MVRGPAIAGRIGPLLRTCAAWYLAAYLAMQFSGLFGPPRGIMEILHRWPALAGVIVLMAGSAAVLAAPPNNGSRRSGPALPRILLHGGLLLAGAGVLVSSLTRFEGRLTLSEGQEGRAAQEAFDPSSVSARRFAPWPDEALVVSEVAPFFTEKRKPVHDRKALLFLRDREHPEGRALTISSLVPRLVGGFFYRISAVGYAPHVQLFDMSGKVIDDAYVVMDLYPPGSEDFFRLPIAPHTVYVRYYPDAAMVRADPRDVKGRTGPLYHVRVARNIDLMENTYASPYEMIPLDTHIFSLQDTKRWVEIRIISDYGLYALIPGLIVALAGAAALIGKKGTRTGREHDAASTAA